MCDGESYVPYAFLLLLASKMLGSRTFIHHSVSGRASITCICFQTSCFKVQCMQVHKILGPGNQYVTAAKMALQNSEAMISMDMPAGPSEVLVIADAAASPAHVAADLLSQAEHGPDSQVCCLNAHYIVGQLCKCFCLLGTAGS